MKRKKLQNKLGRSKLQFTKLMPLYIVLLVIVTMLCSYELGSALGRAVYYLIH
ncbi:hypothetical protein ACVR1G_00305 [Streptococcus dentasini]